MIHNEKEFLWVEKYRPVTIDDCILQPDLKKTLGEIVKSGNLHNLLLCGTGGVGKTTSALALCKMLNLDYILINGSEENGIDVIRNKIRHFASSISLTSDYKVVILDEADYLTHSAQSAFRGFIEEFSNNCRFIFTCNFKNKIIEPLHSRLVTIEYSSSKSTLAKLAKQFMDRMEKILINENVKFDKKVLAELIIKYAPDWRRIIGECQRYSTSGELSIASLTETVDQSFSEMIKYLKDKDFKSMRAWVANNLSLDGSVVFRKIYDSIYDIAKPESIPGAILILADYGYKSSFCIDKEINMVACLTELMGNVEFK